MNKSFTFHPAKGLPTFGFTEETMKRLQEEALTKSVKSIATHMAPGGKHSTATITDLALRVTIVSTNMLTTIDEKIKSSGKKKIDLSDLKNQLTDGGAVTFEVTGSAKASTMAGLTKDDSAKHIIKVAYALQYIATTLGLQMGPIRFPYRIKDLPRFGKSLPL